MKKVPSDLEERYRRFLEGRGDEAVALVVSLREKRSERAEEGAWAALVLSRMYITKGKYDLATSYLRLACELFRSSPGGLIPPGLWVNRAVILNAMGRCGDAEKLLRRVFRISLENGESLAATKAAVNLAIILAGRHEPVEAVSFIEFARQCYLGLGLENGRVGVDLARAFIENRRGNHCEAVEIIHLLSGSAQGNPLIIDRRQRLTALLICAEAHLAMSDTGHARAMLDEIASYREALELFRPVRIHWLRLVSRLERTKGRTTVADGLSATARALAERSGLTRQPPEGPDVIPHRGSAVKEDPFEGLCSDRPDYEMEQGGSGERCPFVTCDAGTISLLERIRQSAPVPVPILFTGESGVGKEVVARLVHKWSGRGSRPFVPVNAAALPSELFESALFGHARGAFTGAGREKKGLLEIAGEGTLFLDEIGELPPGLQVKLLRFLDSGEYFVVGGDAIMRSGARVVAATNRDLESAIVSGRFRQDLFYRLSTLRFHIPPLRERSGDMKKLCAHFLEAISGQYGIGPLAAGEAALNLLAAHSWPGNARELRNVLLSAAIRRRKGTITVSDIPPGVLRSVLENRPGIEGDRGLPAPGCMIYGTNPRTCGETALEDRLRTTEKEMIAKALFEASGNMTRAASILGLKRTTLLYRMKRCGIDPRDKGGVRR